MSTAPPPDREPRAPSAELLAVPGRRAAPRWLATWLAVECVGLALTLHFGWEPFLQPIIAAGLLARALTFGGLLSSLRGALPGGGPDVARARTAGLLGVALSGLLLLDLIPPTFTEAGWDALVGLLVAAQLTAAALFTTRAATRAARTLGLGDIATRAASLPLGIALALAALFPAISPALSPTPWLAPVAAIAAIAAAAASRALPTSAAITAITLTLMTTLAFAEDPDQRPFSALPALVAIATAGLALRRILLSLRDALDRMETAREASAGRPLPPTLEEAAAAGERLSEADAVALVDAELGLDAPPLELPEVSTAEAEAIRAPFIPKPPVAPVAPPAAPPSTAPRWRDAAAATRLLGRAWLALGVSGLFAFFLSLSPLGEFPLAIALVLAVLATLVGAIGLTLFRLDAATRDTEPTPGRRAAFGAAAAYVSAAATIVTPLVPEAAPPLAVITWTGLWLALVLGLDHLRHSADVIAERTLGGRLGNLVAASWFLGVLGLGAVAHQLFAPGDMQWLGAPLRIAAGIVGVGLLLALAFAVHDAHERFEDHAARETRRRR